MKETFGNVKVVSPIRCWDVAAKEEILPPLSESIAELLWRDLIFAMKGTDIVLCTSETALAAAKSEKKVMLTDVILCKVPDFDMKKTILDWEGL